MLRRLKNLWRQSDDDASLKPLEKRLEELHALLQRLKAEAATRDEVGGARSLVASLKSEVEALGRLLDSNRTEFETLRRLLDSHRTEFETLRHTLDTHREELEELTPLKESVRANVDTIGALLTATRAEHARAELVLDAAHSRCDVDAGLFTALEEYRASENYRRIFEQPTPLVSVCIATCNRVRLLVDRCLPSVLSQDYPNLEVVIVGDRCADGTERAVSALGDPRVRYVQLPERGEYPEDPIERWMVAGTPASNLAEELAGGDLISHLDDDDEFMPGRLRKLVDFFRETRAEVVWHPFLWELTQGNWITNPAEEFRHAQATTGSVTFLSWFKKLPFDLHANRVREPGDWNRFRKFKYLGAKLRRFPEPLLRHYREHNQKPQG